MAEQLANNAASTLSAAITTVGATSCTVANGAVFPATGNFRILIDSEIMICTARSGNTLTITRGQESTTAATHLNGAAVTHVLTTGGLAQYILENSSTLTPSARVYHNANQSIANTTPTVLAFNSERFDTDTMHDTVTNNSRLTCVTAGTYLIQGSVHWEANATGYRDLSILLGGATLLGFDRQAALSGVGVQNNVSSIYALSAAEYVQLSVTQNSGGALNALFSSAYTPEFSIVRVA